MPTDQKSRNTFPRIGITVGDVAGIGPEIVLKSLNDDTTIQICKPVVICDLNSLRSYPEFERLRGEIEFVDLGNLSADVRAGEESADTGRASGEFIVKAVELWREGKIDAIATAPISKKALNAGGYNFPGHTEFLAQLTGTADFAMSFFAEKLRVVAFSNEQLERLLHRKVKIAVAGLNPHASENGMFGSEEADRITPAIEDCRDRLGIDVSGPYSPDTVFLRGFRGEFDAVIACYHDQATIAVKSLSFGSAVNDTLGLKLIST